MKRIIKIIFLIQIFAYILGAISCSDMNEYLEFTGGKPISYTGKVDSVKFFSGENRVVFNGLLTSDPKIKKVKIYWNSRVDSLEMDVNRSSGVDTLSASIPLPEGQYNFEIISYDKNETPSIVVSEIGNSYGDIYKQNLYNRVIREAKKEGSDILIDWYNGDETSPFVMLDYIDNNDERKYIKVFNNEARTTLYNYKSRTKIGIQTYYLPDATAVDTFKAAYEQRSISEDITTLVIRNSGNPFLRDQSVEQKGKWGVLADWSYNSNLLNQENSTLGGWTDEDDDWDGIRGGIHLEAKNWNQGGLVNGKIWQSAHLDTNRYSFTFRVARGSGNWNLYFVVMKGKGELPAIDNIEGNPDILARVKVTSTDANEYQIPFELNDSQDITYGWVVTGGNESYLRIKWIKLQLVAD